MYGLLNDEHPDPGTTVGLAGLDPSWPSAISSHTSAVQYFKGIETVLVGYIVQDMSSHLTVQFNVRITSFFFICRSPQVETPKYTELQNNHNYPIPDQVNLLWNRLEDSYYNNKRLPVSLETFPEFIKPISEL